MAPRTIIIGDIHGCYDELRELLDRANAGPDDRVVSVGDMLRKGPHPDRCVELWRASGYLAVLGNQDERLLDRSAWRRWVSAAPDRRMLRRTDLLDFVASWPLFLDFAELGVLVVHAGVLPNGRRFSPDLVPRQAALTLRYVRCEDGEQWRMVPRGEERPGDRFWAEVWSGDRFVVYGHTPRPQPRVDKRALGIDTGCVYGGSLTAAVFTAPETFALLSVRSRRPYAG